MKVLTFTTLYPSNVWPNHGVFVKERMTQFAKINGCEVKVVAPVPYFPPIKANWRWRFSQVAHFEVRDGLDVHHPRYIMTPNWGMSFYGLLMFLSVLPAVKCLRNDFDFDLIDAHFVYPDGFAAVLLGWYFERPVVVSARGSDINLYSQLPLIRRLLRFTLSQAKKVVTVSRALKGAVENLGISAEKIVVIPNGVDMNEFYPMSKDDARSELHLPRKRIVLSAGNLTANKGFDLLIGAFRRLLGSRSGEELLLVLVGEGAERVRLEKLANKLGLPGKVRLPGAVAHGQMRLWYNAADVFCLMSEREGLPNVLLEALACGVPAVATAVGGIPEIITSDQYGILTAREESKITEALRAALGRTWQRRPMTEQAAKFTWDRAARRVRDVFQQILEPSVGPASGAPVCDVNGDSDVIPSEGPVDDFAGNRRVDLQ